MPSSVPRGTKHGVVPAFSPLPGAPEDLAEQRLAASLPDVPAARSGDINTFADLSRNESREKFEVPRNDDEKERRKRYADLLVDVARRQTLLPSDLIVRNSRHQSVRMRFFTTRTALFSSEPLKVLTGTKWFTFFCFVMSIIFCLMIHISLGNQLFAMLQHGGAWWESIKESVNGKIVKYSVVMGNNYPPEGRIHKSRNCSHPVAMPGFGVIERQVSMLSRCKRGNPPKLEWDPAENCSRLVLTYELESAPERIFGWFVVQPPGAEAPTPPLTPRGGRAYCPQPCTSRADVVQEVHDYYRFQFMRINDSTWHDTPWDHVDHVLSKVSKQGTLGTKLEFNLSRHWTSFVRNIGVWSCFALASMSLVVFHFTKDTRFSHRMFCITMFAVSFLYFITHLGLDPPVIGPDDKSANLAGSLLYFIFGCIYTLMPKFPDVFLLLHVIGIEAIRLVFYEGNSAIEFAQTLVPAFTAAIVVSTRAWLYISAKISIRKIERKNNKLWDDLVCSSSCALDHLQRLESIVSKIENRIPTGTVLRQLNLKASYQRCQNPAESTSNSDIKLLVRQQSESVSATVEPMTAVQGTGVDFGRSFRRLLVEDGFVPESGVLSKKQNVHSLIESMPFEKVAATVCDPACVFEADPLSPVTSLDQLWTQAVLLRGFLLPKVLNLAHRFGGVFPVKKQPGAFEKCPDRFWASFKGNLRMGGIKSPERGSEKVDCVYGGDLSRLLDACRETIVFEGLKQLADCLEALRDDPELIIVRIKSSMTKSGVNPHVRTGFRFISVNLRIKTEKTCKLAVHEHICELLLVLKDFAQQVTSETHYEYIQYRNAMSVFDLAILPTVTSAVITVRRRCAYTNFLFLLMLKKCGLANMLPQSLRGRKRKNSVGPEPQVRSTPQIVPGGLSTPTPVISRSRGSRSMVDLTEAAEPNGSPPFNHDLGNQSSNLSIDNEPVFTSWGVPLQESDIHKLECVSLLGSLGLTNLFDSDLIKQPEQIIEQPSTGKEWIVSNIFKPKSLAVTAANRYLLLICLLCGVFLIGSNVDQSLQMRVVESYRHFRYMSLADRQGHRPPTTPGIKEFGILTEVQGSCMMLDSAEGVFGDDFTTVNRQRHGKDLSFETIWDATSITLSYSKKIPFTGWYLESPEQGADVSNFVIMASNSELDNVSTIPSTDPSWSVVGTPSWGGGFFTSPKIDGHNEGKWKRYTMPRSREVTLFEPMAEIPLGKIRPSLGYGIGCCLVAIVGQFRVKLVKPMMIFGIFLGTLVKIIIHATEDRRTSVNDDFVTTHEATGTMTSLASAVLLVGVLVEGRYAQRPMLVAFHICALLTLVASILTGVNDGTIGGSQLQMPNPKYPVFSIVIWILMFLMNISRFIGIRQAQAVVSQDFEAFNEVWERELEKDEGHAALERLALVVKSIEQDTAGEDDDVHASSTAKHIGRKFLYVDGKLAPRAKHTDIASDFVLKKRLSDDILFEKLNVMSVPYTLDSKNTLRSFHQLYVQAMILHDILRGKVEDWAAQSMGYVAIEPDAPPGQSGSGGGGTGGLKFVKWADARADPSMYQRAKWPPLKRSRRAIEKTERVFRGDTSRLADIVRFAIYFDTFTDLTSAMGVIVSDFDIKVELVKSRLRVDYDSRPTAGYRDVNLKLKICNKETAMLGCDTHICELQLVLKSFGELKSDEWHQRYVLFRDLRGE